MKDLYFEWAYGKLYEDIEKGVCESFIFENQAGKVEHLFLKKEIPLNIDGNKYFDLVTPYGYGGPIISELVGEKEVLITGFKEAFHQYCLDHNIVSEFVRFHPLKENQFDFKDIYEISLNRKTVGTNIKILSDETFKEEFSKSTRKLINQQLKRGVSFKVTRGPKNVESFKEVYYSTMDRNNATDYYYFNDKYFEDFLVSFKENILLVEVLYESKVIAAGFYFISEDVIHAHLSGTLNEYLYLSPAYIIKYATVEWAKKNNISLVHYGGGLSSSLDDSLYKFKKKFGQSTEFDFYVGKKIWRKKIYEELCDVHQSKKDDFFPKYRSF